MLIPDIKFKDNSPTSSVGDFVKWWNVNFPLDRWYRVKHRIIWGSERHRETTLLSIYFDYEEERAFKEVADKSKEEQRNSEYEHGDWFNTEGHEISVESSRELFDKIDLNNIPDSGEIEIPLD